ncbi:hypothetical protein Spb1_36030 [Planctopirus ephydatiae]|jgi:hypothetical protein|uniref:Uncharacterized protein n=1 Tax=Planctopirus ephydatiae TaxID=2528019 RepID=A0A518GSU4_9PLAN|nr:hypothetical protein Spb1_36000 [Planctopirus ephydatiae]QDV31658.1 hypothetical protein Spb1_36030 [Planctopirus ephydatiae]
MGSESATSEILLISLCSDAHDALTRASSFAEDFKADSWSCKNAA